MGKLQEKAVLVKLSTSAYRGRKEDRKAESIVMNETGAKSNSTKTYKYLLKDHIAAINTEMGRLRNWHYGITLPWARGIDILPTNKYFDYLKGFSTFKNNIDHLVNGAAAVINEAIKKDLDNLGRLYNQNDYPTEREFRNEYSISMDVMPVPAGADFRVALQNEDLERLARELEEANKEKEVLIKKDLWARMYKPIKKMADTLKTGKTNFQRTLVWNVECMCVLMKDLNVTEDPELDKMREEIEKDLASVEVNDLKQDELTREVTAKKADDILKKMEEYLE